MTWSPSFVLDLTARDIKPVVKLKVIPTVHDGRSAASFTSTTGLLGNRMLAVRSFSIRGASVAYRSWRPGFGDFTVTLATNNPSPAIQSLPRGTVVQLMLGFAGYSDFDLEPLALGVVNDIRQEAHSPTWVVECLDIARLLQARIDEAPDQVQLFHDIADYTTTVRTNYTASDITLHVDDSPVGWPRESGEDFYVAVTNNDGDIFYGLATGVIGGATPRFTGFSGGQLDTTDADADAGNAVAAIWRITDHPINLVLKILESTGTGSASSYDTLPESWGLGIPPTLVDETDAKAWANNVVVAAGGSDWLFTWFGQEPVENPLNALQNDLLSPLGIWITQRQGLITLRSAQDPHDPGSHTGVTITQADLKRRPGAVSHQLYFTEADYEYRKVVVTHDLGTYTPTQRTTTRNAPARDRWNVDVTPVVFTNDADIATDVGDRLRQHYCRIPESWELDCAGFQYAKLCPGDLVYLDFENLWARRSTTTGSFRATQRTAMVLRVDVDLMGDDPGVRLELVATPDDDDV